MFTFASENHTIEIVKRLVEVLGIGLLFVVIILSIGCQGSKKGPAGDDSQKMIMKDSALSDSLKSEMALALEREVVLDRVKLIYTSTSALIWVAPPIVIFSTKPSAASVGTNS